MSDQIGANKVLFSDDFKTALSPTKWDYNHFDSGGSFYGRTQQRQYLPTASNGVLHLQVDTFNPTGGPSYSSFLGSEAITKQSFGLSGGAGVAFEVRAKFVNAPGGLVGGIFPYGGTAQSHNEIDFEALSNDASQNRNRIFTNVFAHEPLGAGHPALVPIPSSLNNYHTYRIEWLPDRVRWLVDGKVVREDKDHVPKDPMQLHLNFWAPDKYWTAAFNAALNPAKSAGANVKYLFDVTSARVEQLSSTYGTNVADSLKGTSDKDWIVGGKGDDSLDGQAKADRLIGGHGHDTLKGGGGTDTVSGGRGRDQIHGEFGNDDLWGGRGADTFFFDTALNSGDNVDRIRDFVAGVDKIALSAAIFGAIGASLASDEFRIGKSAHDGNDRILYNEKNGKLFYDDDGKGGHEKIQIAVLDKHLDLHASDFIVVA